MIKKYLPCPICGKHPTVNKHSSAELYCCEVRTRPEFWNAYVRHRRENSSAKMERDAHSNLRACFCIANRFNKPSRCLLGAQTAPLHAEDYENIYKTWNEKALAESSKFPNFFLEPVMQTIKAGAEARKDTHLSQEQFLTIAQERLREIQFILAGDSQKMDEKLKDIMLSLASDCAAASLNLKEFQKNDT